VVADIDGAAEVVALTIAEFIPRQVMHLQQILAGFPLLGPSSPSTLRPTADPGCHRAGAPRNGGFSPVCAPAAGSMLLWSGK
jgi:hypothetical protein